MARCPDVWGLHLSPSPIMDTKVDRSHSAMRRGNSSIRRPPPMRKGESLRSPKDSSRTRQRLRAGPGADLQVPRWWLYLHLRRDFELQRDPSLRGSWLTKYPVPKKSFRPNTRSVYRDQAPVDASRRPGSTPRRERNWFSLSPAAGRLKLRYPNRQEAKHKGL